MIEQLPTLMFVLTVIATAVMAASAAIQGARLELDLFGATVIAVTTAVGGGTVRDMLLGRMPVFWITDLTYLYTAVPVAVVMFYVSTRLPTGNGKRLRLLMQFDAVGLALFTLVGVRVAQEMETHAAIAVVIGVITGTVGGMIRDVLCNVTPSVLKEDLYATISLIGGVTYLVLNDWIGEEVASGVCFLGMLLVRLIVIARMDMKAQSTLDG
ncbi:trimeric intracellular cation channel family protein [Shimia sp. Alg240-R146]|uniref:trimeric intracellular cation channel family protein n=1 Tax=Shimia sp. Alg240-R146 TaxID=2993449 RepID=UPI0022E43689|nr:trimeric intracellular cation channel family protein [Shimia sp. Alg240-R146]